MLFPTVFYSTFTKSTRTVFDSFSHIFSAAVCMPCGQCDVVSRWIFSNQHASYKQSNWK